MKRIFLTLLLCLSTAANAAAFRTAVLDMVSGTCAPTCTFTFPAPVTAGDLLFIATSTSATPSAVATTGSVSAMSLASSNTSDPMGVGFSVFVYTIVATSGMTGIAVTMPGGEDVVAVLGGVQDSDAFSAVGFRTGTFSDAYTQVPLTTLTLDEVAIGMSTAATPTAQTLTPDSGNALLEQGSTDTSFYSTAGLGAAGSKVIGGVMSGAEFGWGFAVSFRHSGGGAPPSTPKQLTTLKAG